MTLHDWATNTAETIRSEGVVGGTREATYQLYLGAVRRYCWAFGDDSGSAVFGHDWDLLIVLDACRTDLIAAVEDEYSFLSTPDTLRSLGGNSSEWMAANFTQEFAAEMANTAYVSGNIFTQEYADPSAFHTLDEVWKYAWDDERGTIPARPITERAISTWREERPERLLVHYMQPHAPSVPDPIAGGMTTDPGADWVSAPELLRRGEVDRRRIWESYLANLRYVLNEVSLLLENVDTEIAVITADHGELFGEYGLYDHPHGITFDTLRRVPWYITEASDEQTFYPTLEPEEETGDRRRKLESLGYL